MSAPPVLAVETASASIPRQRPVADPTAVCCDLLKDGVPDEDVAQVIGVAAVRVQRPIGAAHHGLCVHEQRATLFGHLADGLVVDDGNFGGPAGPGGQRHRVIGAAAKDLMIDADQYNQCARFPPDVGDDLRQVDHVILDRHARAHVVESLGDDHQVGLQLDAVLPITLNQRGLGRFLIAGRARRDHLGGQATVKDLQIDVLETPKPAGGHLIPLVFRPRGAHPVGDAVTQHHHAPERPGGETFHHAVFSHSGPYPWVVTC